MKHLFDLYGNVQEDLKFMVKSNIRLQIMLCLADGPKTSKEIKNYHGLSFPAIFSNMKRLMEEDLVQKVDGTFVLSSFGRIKLYSIFDFYSAIKVSNNFPDLFLNHDIGGVPDFLMEEIGVFFDSNMVESSRADIYKIHNNFKILLKDSNEIFGVSPISHPDYMDIFQDLLSNDVKACLVLTDDIIKKTLDTVGFKNMMGLMENKNLKIRRYPGDLNIAFTVTNNFMSLGFFGDDGVYDQSKDLISKKWAAIEWTKKLFDYYYQKSEEVEIDILVQIMASQS
ncbi:MAG: DUF1724 domain-containing protein [Methanobacteriaceae archaeon]|nr:DUF1724 domain-containing protein [Methanobacteriaceae archaeon]